MTPCLTVDSALHRYDNFVINATTIFAARQLLLPVRFVLCLPILRRVSPIAGQIELQYDRVMDDPAQSFGCVGMRINTGVPENLLLMVIPRNILATLTTSLPQMSEVHRQMEAHYMDRVANLP